MSKNFHVGRESELQVAMHHVRKAAQGHGGVVLVDGVAGSGKSLFMDHIQECCKTDDALNGIRFAYAYCHEATGPNDAYQPFADILADLSRSLSREPGFLQHVVRETAPDWLSVIPVVGPILGASLRTTYLARKWLFWREEIMEKPQALFSQFVALAQALSAEDQPLVLVVEDAHWIDRASADLILRLAEAFQSLKVLLVLTYRTEFVSQGHPLRASHLELTAKGLASIIAIRPLDMMQVGDYLGRRFGSCLDANFPAWLMHLTKGHPLFMTQYLNLLEQEGMITRIREGFVLDGRVDRIAGRLSVSGRLAELQVPESVEAVLERRIERMLEEERELLQLGAVQGDNFLSAVLAKLTHSTEQGVLAQLRQIAATHRVISLNRNEGWYSDRSEAYAFEHALLHNAFYRRLSPRERVLYHQGVAEILQSTFAAGDEATGRRTVLLEIAHHYHAGGQPEESGKYLLNAAETCFADGALDEAGELALQASERLAQQACKGEGGMCLRAIVLALIAGSQGADPERRSRLLELAESGERLAGTAGDAEAASQILSVRGHLLVQAGSVDDGLLALEQALTWAERSGEPLVVCQALAHLGSEQAKRDLKLSVETRERAYRMLSEQVLQGEDDEWSLPARRFFHRLDVTLGVGLFDSGSFDAAEHRLLEGTRGLRELGLHRDLCEGLNYLAQLYWNTGRYCQAEQALREALNLMEDEHNAWYACNLGLLGRIRLEQGDLQDAGELLRQATELSEIYLQADLISIVRNYLAEYQLHPAQPGSDTESTRVMLEDNIRECLAWGLERSAVVAYGLLSEYWLGMGDREQALDASTRSVEILETMGTLPAVRSEALWYQHARVLNALGQPEGAGRWLQRARDHVQKKAASIADPEKRDTYLHHVELNRRIIAPLPTPC